MSLVSINSLLTTVFTVLLNINTNKGADWNYDWNDLEYGPFGWADYVDTCGGREQSPINIDHNSYNGFNELSDKLEIYNITSSLNGNTLLDLWEWSNNEFIYHFEASNNGHSIQLVPIDSEGNYLTHRNDSIARFPNIFGSTESAEEYCLHSFHYHWGEYNTMGSEHTFYGISYPAEIHFVHFSCNYETITDAMSATRDLNDNRVLAVIGFLFEVDDDATAQETAVFTELYQRIYDLEYVGDTATLPNINLLGNILPNYMSHAGINSLDSTDRSQSNFWHYRGGLTTPDCLEFVNWHVMDYKPKITSLQLTTLRSLNGSHGKMTHNWRPVQSNRNPLYIFEFESDETTNGDNNENNSNSDDSNESIDSNDSNENNDSDESNDSDNSSESNESNENDEQSIIGDLDDIEDKQDDIYDIVLVILIIVIVFCVLWVGYSAIETTKGNKSNNQSYNHSRRDSVSANSRGGNHETAAFVKK